MAERTAASSAGVPRSTRTIRNECCRLSGVSRLSGGFSEPPNCTRLTSHATPIPGTRPLRQWQQLADWVLPRPHSTLAMVRETATALRPVSRPLQGWYPVGPQYPIFGLGEQPRAHQHRQADPHLRMAGTIGAEVAKNLAGPYREADARYYWFGAGGMVA